MSSVFAALGSIASAFLACIVALIALMFFAAVAVAVALPAVEPDDGDLAFGGFDRFSHPDDTFDETAELSGGYDLRPDYEAMQRPHMRRPAKHTVRGVMGEVPPLASG